MSITIHSWTGAVSAALVAALASAAILCLLLVTGLAWRLATDVPNHRSMHSRPTPRVGGWGIVPVSAGLLLWLAPGLWLTILAAVALAALSQLDDRRGLPARVRFAVHFAAVALLLARYPVDLPWWMIVGIGFLMIWLINLYNFMDGADGLAGGMALFGFGAYALAAGMGPHPSDEPMIAGAVVAGAAAGFLLLNFHPARLFLGDAGSIPLGFLAGAIGYWGWRASAWPVWFPALVFAPFIADASVTLVKRLLRGEKFWLPHREHYYQRMVRGGMGHAYTALCWYGVMGAGVLVALWALWRPVAQQWLACVAWYGVLAGFGACVDVYWRRAQRAAEHQS